MSAKSDDVLYQLLFRLENIQREVGEVQSAIVALLSRRDSDENSFAFAAATGGTAGDSTPAGSVPSQQSTGPQPGEGSASPCIDPADWLSARGITLVRTANQSGFDETFDRLALYLGRRFQNIRRLYEAIKRRVGGSPEPRSLNLSNESPKVISDTCQFGKDLYQNGFLSRYRYDRETRILGFDPQRDGRVVNFFTGDWLERFVLLSALERLRALLEEGANPVVVTKAVVSLPTGQETEFDILIGLPKRILWMECKTGDWQEHAAKFGRVSRHLGLSPEHAALVLLDPLTPEQKRNASTLSSMTVISPEEVEDFVEREVGLPPARTELSS